MAVMSDISRSFIDSAQREGLTIVIGTGSVAATNLGGLVYELGRVVPGPRAVILTAAAQQFVTPATVRHLGRCPVLREETITPAFEPLHVWLTDVARRVLVYPASAGFLARLAAGLATDLATTTLLCATGIPTLVVPSMHRRMWANHIVQRNVRHLRAAGMHVLDPPAGMAPGVADVISTLTALPVVGAGAAGPAGQADQDGQDGQDGQETTGERMDMP